MSLDIIGDIHNCRITLSDLFTQKNKTREDLFKCLSLELSKARQVLVVESKKLIWKKSIKYKWPTHWIDAENGFDCSGLITFLLEKYWLSQEWIRHTNEYFDQYWVFTQNPIPWDLIFFSKTWIAPSHIWIYLWENKYIHAPWKNWTQIGIWEIKKRKIKQTTNGQLYSSNPIWFKRLTLKVNQLTEQRWDTII